MAEIASLLQRKRAQKGDRRYPVGLPWITVEIGILSLLVLW